MNQSEFTAKAQAALLLAERCARGLHQSYVGTEHILVGLMREGSGVAARVLLDNGVNEQDVIELIRDFVAPENILKMKERSGYSKRAIAVLEESRELADKYHSDFIGTEHILMAMIKEGENVAARLLNTIGISLQKIYVDILVAMGEDGSQIKEDIGKKNSKKKENSLLKQYSRDLTLLAREGKLDPVIGRDIEIKRVIQILSRRTKNNPCLVGEPGVGKTAIVEGLAERIVAGDVPDTVKNKRVLTLDLSGMVAGSKYRGEFEERIKKVVKEVIEDGNVLLFLDELHTLIGAGGAEGAIDASNILKPSLARGEIQLIGATTISEYRKYIEKDAALERRFQPVSVEEPTEEEAVAIVKGIRSKYEEHHRVTITDEAVAAAVSLSGRYINDRNLPDKAIDLMDEAASAIRLVYTKSSGKLVELEKQIQELEAEFEQALKDNDLLDNTVIVAYADHYLYTLSDKTILDQYKQTENNLINHTPFFIWSNDMERVNVNKVTSQIDILPTVLNLFGIQYKEEYYIGNDAFDKKYKGYVFFSDYSWYDGKIYVENGEIVNGAQADPKYVEEMNQHITELIEKNDYVLIYDYFR